MAKSLLQFLKPPQPATRIHFNSSANSFPVPAPVVVNHLPNGAVTHSTFNTGEADAPVTVTLCEGTIHEFSFSTQFLVCEGAQVLFDVLLGTPFDMITGGRPDAWLSAYQYRPFLQNHGNDQIIHELKPNELRPGRKETLSAVSPVHLCLASMVQVENLPAPDVAMAAATIHGSRSTASIPRVSP